ncbi:hypothetical protein D3C75_1045780 [compost metagenome]
MINIGKIMVDAVDVQLGCILQIPCGLLLHNGNGSQADDQVQHQHGERDQNHDSYIMADGIRFAACFSFDHSLTCRVLSCAFIR